MGKSREGHGTATVAIFPEHESYHRILTTDADDVPCNFQLTTFFYQLLKDITYTWCQYYQTLIAVNRGSQY